MKESKVLCFNPKMKKYFYSGEKSKIHGWFEFVPFIRVISKE